MAKIDSESEIRNLTCWNKVEKQLSNKVQSEVKLKPRRGWNTIRIFVSSTFKDFHYERDVLVKKVFPDLRIWCQGRKLHLVECDLRWGAPKQFKDLEKLKMCMGELDRCYAENYQQPFFINMNSRRIGWIPQPGGEIPSNVLEEYGLVFGFSITEMEIFYGAYRIQNPNAMFLLRDPSVFETLPNESSKMTETAVENTKKALEDFAYDEYAEKKLEILREKINERFLQSPKRKSTIIEYSARFKEFNDEGKVILEIDNEDKIISQIITFFKDRIGKMYPPPEKITDKFKDRQLAHEAFMQFKDQDILGRDDILAEIDTYIHTDSRDVPLLLLGGPGTGKSSIMARAANNACKHVQNNGDTRHVFYHFVGAVPGSTEPLLLLQRLLREVGEIQENELPTDMDTAIQMTYSALNHPQVKPVIIFIDALNQLDDNQQLVPLMNWVPRKLSDKVKCVFSMIPETAGTSHYKVLKDRESQPIELQVTDLDRDARKNIVTKFFEKWTKILDDDQMNIVLMKECSKNPLWLTIACEEMRVHGNFRTMDDKIMQIQDDLLLLIEQVLERFEKDSGDKSLLKATLCLIEVSNRGLLESELFYILGDRHLLPGQEDKHQEKGDHEQSEKSRYTDMDRLPAFQWNLISRSLGPFLRPFGDLGEGRLDFYHRSVSKAVRNKYLKSNSDNAELGYNWWHSKLADYFEVCEHANVHEALDRKIEEYPHHLIAIQDDKRLLQFMDDWKIFDKLYDREHSIKLLLFWDNCGGPTKMTEYYTEKLKQLTDKRDRLQRYEQVGRVLLQYGVNDESLNLARTGLDIAKGIINEIPKLQLAGYFTLLADIYDTIYRQSPAVTADNIPLCQKALHYSSQSVKILKELGQNDTVQKKLYGKYLMRHAKNHSSLADSLGEYTEGPVEQATKEGFTPESARSKGQEILEEAFTLFEEMQEKGLMAEAMKTKGNLNRDNFNTRIKLLKEAKDMCQEAYGDSHSLMARILNNIGVTYADNGDYEVALKYYIQSYEVFWELLGNDHPDTQSALLITHDPFYVRHYGKYEGKK